MATNSTSVGLGIANGPPAAAPPSKRRKIEKQVVATPLGGLPMERAMSSVYGSNIGSARGAAGSPRETPAAEAPKKRGRATGGSNGNARRRLDLTIHHTSLFANRRCIERTQTIHPPILH